MVDNTAVIVVKTPYNLLHYLNKTNISKEDLNDVVSLILNDVDIIYIVEEAMGISYILERIGVINKDLLTYKENDISLARAILDISEAINMVYIQDTSMESYHLIEVRDITQSSIELVLHFK